MFSSIDTVWVIFAAGIVFFMQAGFAMVETGFTRAKNSGNIIMKNLMDYCLGILVFWALGFGIMFGASNFGIIGTPDFFVQNEYTTAIPTLTFWLFQAVFCATTATIVSGAMAERTKFSSYCLYSIVISAVIYPISGHWIWGGGFLSEMGFHDFAGSTAVHMVGGLAALAGAKVLGPRIGKYTKDGKSNAIPGHNLTLGALGVFILWFGWFGFNGGSTISATGDDVLGTLAKILVNTNIAAAAAAAVTMLITWIRYKKPDVSMTLNGALAGLVGITAGCDAVSPIGSFFIGVIAGIVVVFGIEFIDKVLKIDDPVGAIGVHGFGGAIGTILVGVFALDGGLLYGGGLEYLGTQAIGVAIVAAWILGTMFPIFFLIKHTIGLRVTKEEEIGGLDIAEHGLVSSYADFMPRINGDLDTVSVDTAIPVVVKSAPAKRGPAEAKMSLVTIITNPQRFTKLKEAMEKIEITGMTITHVQGCGMQKGASEYYRGVKMEMDFLPKVQVDIVVCKIPVETVVETARNALYTGHIGDGKIFVYHVENVIKVRTGEEGYDALQDDEYEITMRAKS